MSRQAMKSNAGRMAFDRALGERLQRARKDFGASQELIAECMGVERTSITNIELGKQSLSVYRLYQYCASMGLNPKDFLP